MAVGRLTNYGENRLADMIRGVTPTLPTNWYFGLLSDAADATYTELSGSGYSRQLVLRALASFAGTQAPGSLLASTGTSHTTSNNNSINFGTAGATWGTLNFVGMFDAATSGNCWAYLPAVTGLTISSGDTFSLGAGALAFSLGLTGGMTDYLANKLIDFLMRGQAYSFPSPLYVPLYTTLPTNAGTGGVEVIGDSYARVAIPSTTTAWSGTQSAGSTTSSTGTGGRISNNVAITYNSPPVTENWGAVLGAGLIDAATLGNLLFWRAFANGTQTINGGTSSPGFEPNALGITFD